MRKAVKEEEKHRPKLLRRAKEFDDKGRAEFVKNRVTEYKTGKKWIRFTWVELVRFFGRESTWRITRVLGGKEFYVTKANYKPRKSDDKELKWPNRKWRKLSREQLKSLIGIETEKILFKYFKGTYISIPARRWFATIEYFSFGQIHVKTIERLEIIDKRLRERVSRKDIAASLGISPRTVSHYIKTFQLKPLR